MKSNKEHPHSHHGSEENHGHSHARIDPSILSHEKGLWAVKWSFIGLGLTALFQTAVVLASHSVALLSDTIHNVGDAATAVPLGAAFLLARLKPSKKFTYGYGRVEDLAGVAVVLTILFSAIVAGYEAVQRFFHPVAVSHIWAVALASIVGFLGNEGVAVFRIRVGKEIGSVALIADGYHARVDGYTSLAVLLGAIGVWLNFPLADAIVGLGISIAIFFIVWRSAKDVLSRMLDGIEPEVIDEIKHAAEHVSGVLAVNEVRAKWIGHKLHAEINITVDSTISVAQGHEIAKEVRHQLLHHLKHLSNAMIHVDPANASGEMHHRIESHKHDHLALHSHI